MVFHAARKHVDLVGAVLAAYSVDQGEDFTKDVGDA